MLESRFWPNPQSGERELGILASAWDRTHRPKGRGRWALPMPQWSTAGLKPGLYLPVSRTSCDAHGPGFRAVTRTPQCASDQRNAHRDTHLPVPLRPGSDVTVGLGRCQRGPSRLGGPREHTRSPGPSRARILTSDSGSLSASEARWQATRAPGWHGHLPVGPPGRAGPGPTRRTRGRPRNTVPTSIKLNSLFIVCQAIAPIGRAELRCGVGFQRPSACAWEPG
jgi:hypothetical protein